MAISPGEVLSTLQESEKKALVDLEMPSCSISMELQSLLDKGFWEILLGLEQKC